MKTKNNYNDPTHLFEEESHIKQQAAECGACHTQCNKDHAEAKNKGHAVTENDEAVVFEDSVNGVLAARRAGIFVVAVPNPLTAKMRVTGDLTLSSLAELSLELLSEVHQLADGENWQHPQGS